jgi:hypothetical protein
MNILLRIKQIREELKTTSDQGVHVVLTDELDRLIEEHIDTIISTLGTAALAMHYRVCGTGPDYMKLSRAYDDLETQLTSLGVNLSNVNEA